MTLSKSHETPTRYNAIPAMTDEQIVNRIVASLQIYCVKRFRLHNKCDTAFGRVLNSYPQQLLLTVEPFGRQLAVPVWHGCCLRYEIQPITVTCPPELGFVLSQKAFSGEIVYRYFITHINEYDTTEKRHQWVCINLVLPK